MPPRPVPAGLSWKQNETTKSVMIQGISMDGQAGDRASLYTGLIIRHFRTGDDEEHTARGKDVHELGAMIRDLPRPITLCFEDNEWTPTRYAATFAEDGLLGITWKTDPTHEAGSMKSYPPRSPIFFTISVRQGNSDRAPAPPPAACVRPSSGCSDAITWYSSLARASLFVVSGARSFTYRASAKTNWPRTLTCATA